ncbi:MAG TPA: IPT/TIG domain-containing protein [Dehalococcoidia bacterium]|nr:IPT/TIG domain-containing protein [Dehalococcoidia bacterium]
MLNTTPAPLPNCGPTPTPTPTPGQMAVYGDALAAPWADQSWNSVINFAAMSPVHGGTAAISFQVKAAWGALSFYDGALVNTGQFTALRFWLRASQAGQSYVVGLEDENNQLLPGVSLAAVGGPITASQWKQYVVPISQINPGNVPIAGIYLQDGLGTAQPPLAVDDMAFDNTPLATPTPAPTTPGRLVVYDDHLVPGWGDASWGSSVDYFNPAPVHGGAASIALTITTAWGALYPFATSGLDTTPFTELTLWAQASQGGQAYDVSLVDSTNALIKLLPLASYGGALPAGSWQQYRIPLADLNGVGKTIKGFAIQDGLGAAQPPLYVDDIVFDVASNPAPTTTSVSPASATAGGAAFTLTVNGSNFISSSTVQWNGMSLSTSFVSATQLTAAVPAGNVAAPGTATVTVVNPAPGGGASNGQTFTINAAVTRPGAPALASPAEGATNVSLTPSLSWTAPGGAIAGSTQYTAYIWDPAAVTMKFQQGTTALSLSVPAGVGLAPSRFYYWMVQACNGSACGPQARWIGFTTAAVPGAPGLTSPIEGSTGVSTTPVIQWTAPTGAAAGLTQYTAYVWDPGAGVMAYQGTTAALNLSVPPAAALRGGRFYYYTAVACNSTACGPNARWEGFTTQAPAALGTPSLTAPAEGATGVSLTPTIQWTAPAGSVSDTTQYTVYVWDPGAGVMAWQGTTTQRAIAVPGGSPLAAGRFYYMSVQACNGATCGPLARWEGFTTGGGLGAPGLLTPAEGSTNNGSTPIVRWAAPSGAGAGTSYIVYVWDPAAGVMKFQQSVSGLSAGVPASAGLQAGHFYYYTARACDGSACGPLARWEGFTS